jgi:4-amino-4-deoxy-L-arabinose transferase-like glycosyltransferase
VLSFLRKHKVCFALAIVAGVALRIFFIANFKLIDGDSLIYGDLAKNWLVHGVFGISDNAGPNPTYIRLPGYPAFMVAIWRFAGLEHYTAVFIAQVVADIGACFVVADVARRTVSERATLVAFWLTALCPFIAIYTAAPLSETLAIFFAALALNFALIGLDDLPLGRTRYWMACGLALSAGILLRPDGGILLGAIGLFLLYRMARPGQVAPHAIRRNAALAGLLVTVFALSPLIPWTIRNWRDFHRFQPLAPRYANEPDEPVNMGFQRWVKTWMVDYVSVVDVYWNLPGAPVDPHLLPDRAFQSPEERQQTYSIFADYNRTLHWTDSMDSALGRIADARIRRAPLRYYLVLPALRIVDMWFRPRTDLLRTNDRWWEFDSDPRGTYTALFVIAVNAFYIGAALWGLFRRRDLRYAGLLILFVVLRSAFLGTLENPETRYTLECFPVVIAFASAALAGRLRKDAFSLKGRSFSRGATVL